MRNRKRIILIVVLLILLIGGVALFIRWRAEQAQAAFEPPIVLINEPRPGTTIYARDGLAVSASAFGRVPVRRAELWVDGQLNQSRDSATSGGISPFYADFNFVPSEGPHSIMVRAANVAEVIGQSLPYQFSALANPKVAEGTTPPLTTTLPSTPPTPVSPSPSITGTLPPGFVPPSAPPQLGGGNQPGGGGVPGGGDQPGGGGVPSGGDNQAGGAPPPIPPLTPIDPNPLPVDDTFVAIPGLIAANFSPPAAPTNLTASVQNCKVRLVWKDNANNEKEYDVWMKGWGLPPRVIATLKPALGGTAWFEFPAPGPGYYTFWVEAVGLLGSKQPSNQFGPILIPQTCPATLATKFDVKLANLKISASADKAYCYVLFDDAPQYIKMPVGDNEFFRPIGGIWAWFPGPIPPPGTALAPGFEDIGSFSVPIPNGDTLLVKADCWGFSGSKKSPDPLGAFSVTIPQKDWDCQPHEIGGGILKVTITLCQGGGNLSVQNPGDSYGFDDPTIPAPYDVKQSGYKCMWPPCGNPLDVAIDWKWSGDETKITGFVVYYNGAPIKTLTDRTKRGTQWTLSALCGLTNKWTVAALTQTSQSPQSAPYVDKQDPCGGTAVARFETIDFQSTTIVGGAGSPKLPCENMYMAYRIGMNSVYRDMSNRQFVGCGSHLFINLAIFENVANPQSQSIWVKIDPKQKIGVQIFASFYDHSDLVADHYLPLEFASWSDAIAQTDQCGKTFTSSDQKGSIASKMTVGLSFYPNVCSATPHD